MPKRGENIRKRKDGRWEGRYKKGVDGNGKTIYGSVYGKTYREVKTKQQEKMVLVAQGLHFSCNGFLLRDAAYLWLEDSRIRLKGATECKYRNLLETHIIPDLGESRLDKLSGTDINSYLANKLDHGRIDGSGGLAPSYVKSIMLILKSVLTYAAESKMCSPVNTKITKPQTISKELPILTSEEQKALEAVCLAGIDETKIGVILSLYAGLRIGEVCALEWSDVDFQSKKVHIRKTVSRVRDPSMSTARSMLVIERSKTKASFRDIPLCSWLIPVLEEVRSKGKSKYVVSTGMQFVSPRTYDYRYHKLLSVAGLWIRTINTMPSACAATGYSGNQIMLSPTSRTTPGVVPQNMQRKQIFVGGVMID